MGIIVTLSIIILSAYTLSNSILLTNAETTLTPAFVESTINAGETQEFVFKVQTEPNQVLTPTVLSGYVDENNQIQFIDKNLYSNWVVKMKNDKPNEARVTISIPLDTPSGFYVPLVKFSSINSNQDTQLGIGYSLIGAIFLKVNNPNDDGINSEIQFKTVDIHKSISFDRTNKISLTYQNNGNVYTKPIGYVELFDPEGYKLSTTFQINSEYKNLIPQAERTEEIDWEDKDSENKFFPQIGEYKVKFYIKSEEAEKYNTYEDSFMVIPNIYFFYVLTILIGTTTISLLAIRRKRTTNQQTS